MGYLGGDQMAAQLDSGYGAGTQAPVAKASSGPDYAKAADVISRMMNKKAQPAQQVQVPGDALGRRQQMLDNSPQFQVANAINLAKQIPDPQERADTLYPLMKAQYVAGGG